MKKSCILIITLVLFLSMIASVSASEATAPTLSSLSHNCTNTGIMMPATFSPDQRTYLLTVASWVSRVKLTPATASPNAMITVNGQPVASGETAETIKMTNEPQMVTIAVYDPTSTNPQASQTVYTVYLQRRPSEKRTKVSAGFLTDVSLSEEVCTISADLVTLTYQPHSNQSGFVNDTVYIYKYRCADNCLFYYGTANNPIRAYDAAQFKINYLNTGNNLYNLVYMEDEIVAVLPYEAN